MTTRARYSGAVKRAPRTWSLNDIADTFSDLRADYRAAQPSRFKKTLTGVVATGSGADYHTRIETQYYKMMEQFREMDRNDSIVGQAISRVVDNVTQHGISVDPKTGDPEADTYLRDKFDMWACDPDQCDLEGESRLGDLCRFILRAVLVDGDIVATATDTGAVETIEAHRIKTPTGTKRNVVLGVLLDNYRRRLEYWVSPRDIDPLATLRKVNEIVPIPVRDKQGRRQLFHIYDPKRKSQTRGISALAPIVDTAGMADDIQFAKLVQQQVVSCITFIRERGIDFNSGAVPAATGSTTDETLANGGTRTIQGIAPGLELVTAPGEKITGFSPNVPNAEYFNHIILILSIIAVNLGIPVQLLLLDASKTNFSGWRGAMDQARVGFKRLWEILVCRFLCPVYLWKLREWVATDAQAGQYAAALGEQFWKHEWMPPHWPYIEPEKDAQGDALIIEKRLAPRRLVLGRRGLNIERVDETIVKDNARFIRLCIKEAESINVESPAADVDWRTLAFMEPPTTTVTGPPMPTEEGVATEKKRASGNAGATDDEGDDDAGDA